MASGGGRHEQKDLCAPGGLEVPACSFRGPLLWGEAEPQDRVVLSCSMRKRV